MASSPDYLAYVREQLEALPGVSHRAMMGEYILYYQGRIVGGIYDDRLLVKPTPAAAAMLPGAPREQPYPGAKELLLVENIDDRDFLCALFQAMLPELPARGKRK